MIWHHFLFAMVTAAAVGGCGGSVAGGTPDGGGGGDGGSGSESSGGGTGNGSGGSSGSGGGGTSEPASFTGTQVQAALTQCSLAHGQASSVSTEAVATQRIIGAWFLCTTHMFPDTMFYPGIELAQDGTWTRLDYDASGGLTRGAGVQEQGTWNLSCEASSPFPADQTCPGQGSPIELQLTAASGDTDPGSCSGGILSFEDSPRRAHLADYPCDASYEGGVIDVWLVPLGP